MKIITVANHKGGVGKTTTVITLAHALARLSRRTLVVDFDPQGQSAVALGLSPAPGVFNVLVSSLPVRGQIISTGRENFDLLPGDPSTATAQIVLNAESRPVSAVADALKPVLRDYDFVFFDTAPSIGGLQERVLYASQYVLLPTATEYLALDGLSKIMQMFSGLQSLHQWKGKLLGVLPTFYDDTTRESRESLGYLRRQFVCFDPIHRATVLRESAAYGITIFEKDPNSRAAQEYATLATEILKLD